MQKEEAKIRPITAKPASTKKNQEDPVLKTMMMIRDLSLKR